MNYKRPDHLPERLRKEVWTPPERTAPIDLALPTLGEGTRERFRTEQEAVAAGGAQVTAEAVPVVVRKPIAPVYFRAGIPAPTPAAVRLQPPEVIPPEVVIPEPEQARRLSPLAIALASNSQPEPTAAAAPASPLATEPTQPALDPTSVVSIQINLPKLHLPSARRGIRGAAHLVASAGRKTSRAGAALLQHKRVALAAAAVVVLMLGGGTMLEFKQKATQKSAQASDMAAAKTVLAKAAAPTVAKPSFQPLAPADSKNNAVNGTPQVAYDTKRNTYSFTDTIGGHAVVVSQQPIPATYKTAVDAVSKIAISLKANQTATTDSGAAYIASDAKSNTQTVVFSKNNLLVFVQSPFSHTTAQWQAYINALKTQ